MPSKTRNYRGVIRPGGDQPRTVTVECPRCGALPGNRCWALRSWVVTATGGFYTAKNQGYHPERKAAAAAVRGEARAVRDAGADRAALRKEIGRLVVRKLGGHDRMQGRRYAGHAGRTDAELAEYRDALAAMPDLP